MDRRGAYMVLMGRSERERPFGRWKENIKMNLEEVGCGGMNWIDLVQDTDRWRTLVNAAMNLRFP
jgi:hypothetical protein